MMEWAGKRLGIFCDFDGTISKRDMIGRIVMEFAPDAGRPLIEAVVSRQMSIRDGVSRMMGLIPSSRYEEVRAFALASTEVRAGFYPFVAHCQAKGWGFTVVSGGFDFFVAPVIEPCSDVPVYCNRINTDGEFFKVEWPYPCDADCTNNCGLCKPSILKQHQSESDVQIVIGDGVTDLAAALQADFVFARDRLLDECQSRGLRHAPFDTFDDIASYLEVS